MNNEITTNEQGGKRSKIEGSMTEIPSLALLEVSKVMGLGETIYPRDSDGTPNWHKLDCKTNLDHALRHCALFEVANNNYPRNYGYMRKELSHFVARAMMALEKYLIENEIVFIDGIPVFNFDTRGTICAEEPANSGYIPQPLKQENFEKGIDKRA